MDEDREIGIHITQFNPLQITWPRVDTYVGKVRLTLPDVHIQLFDLSMGIDLLKGAHIGGDGPAFGITMTIPEPGITPGQMMELIHATQDTLEEMWRVAQKKLDETGPLLDKK